jgi:hypothetical protein
MRFSLQSTATREEQRVAVSIRIDEAEPLFIGRRRTAWRPEYAMATYERSRRDGEEWGRWAVMSVRVGGHNAREDGKPGAEVAHRLYGRPTGRDELAALAPFYDEVVRRTPSAILPLTAYADLAAEEDRQVAAPTVDLVYGSDTVPPK